MLVGTPGIGDSGVCQAVKDGDLRDDCINIMLPTLVVCGAEDGATTPEAVRALADAIPAARYLDIPDAGHLPCIEQPEVLADAIDTFMKENPNE